MEEQNKIVTVVELSTQQAQQELVKLNATVSNSTKSLEERIAAKNKAIEIQNQLSKKTIEALENERRTLEGSGASAKQLDAIFIKQNLSLLKLMNRVEHQLIN
jgi:phage terminase large subunit-like protein